MTDVSKIRKALKKFDKETFDERYERIAFLDKLIGKSEYRPTPFFAAEYFEEAKSCFINGDFIVSIIMCQLVCEEMLKDPYRFTGEVKVVDSYGFADLIEKAQDDSFISADDACKLHKMRKFRNLMEHTKDFSHKKYSLRFISQHKLLLESEKQAKESVKLMIKLMNQLSFLYEHSS